MAKDYWDEIGTEPSAHVQRSAFESMFVESRKREKPDGSLLAYLKDLNNQTLFEKGEAKKYAFVIFLYKQKFRMYKKALSDMQDKPDMPSAMRLRAMRKACKRMHVAYRNFFIQKNLRLVVFMAKGYIGKGVGLDDLIQYGNLGLIRSVKMFDPRKGFSFSTYAFWWIRQQIVRGFISHKLIRVPAYIIEKSQRVHGAMLELASELNREPTAEEIAKRAGVRSHVVAAILQDKISPLSLDAPLLYDDSKKGGFIDVLSDFGAPTPETRVAEGELRDAIQKALKVLSGRERDILSMRFGFYNGEEVTLDEIGKKFHLTRERIRQIQRKALRTLAQNKDIREVLAPFLEHIDTRDGMRISHASVIG